MFTNLFKRKEKLPLPDFKEVTVKLKPLFGIRPGIYLSVIYGFMLLLLIFLLFFLPGIIANGTYIIFTSAPVKAAVWIDGKRAGVTPCELLVPQGVHEIIISSPNYNPVTMKRDVSAFIFALPGLPKKDAIIVSLQVSDISALAAAAFKDFSSWALFDEFSTAYQYPPVLSEAAKSIIASPTPETYKALSTLLEAALPHVHLPQLADDYLRALFIVESKGKGFTPASMSRVISRMIKLLGAHENMPFWIFNILPKKLTSSRDTPATSDKNARLFATTKDELVQAAWFKQYTAFYKTFLERFATTIGARLGGGLSLQGLSFVAIPAGTYIMGKSDSLNALTNLEYLEMFPHPVRVAGIYMANTEVTNWQFKMFLDENPSWRPDHREKLISLSLVTEDYLKDWKDNHYPEGKAGHPVTFVSAFAAEAYCAWLTQKLAHIMPGFVARLPFEAEWEWAAAGGYPDQFKTPGSHLLSEQGIGTHAAGASLANSFGLADMAGNVFEWCIDWYAQASPLLSSRRAEKNDYTRYALFGDGGAKVVRGGSWATPEEEIKVYTRASQPPEFCTPYLGFRPVIAEK